MPATIRVAPARREDTRRLFAIADKGSRLMEVAVIAAEVAVGVLAPERDGGRGAG